MLIGRPGAAGAEGAMRLKKAEKERGREKLFSTFFASCPSLRLLLPLLPLPLPRSFSRNGGLPGLRVFAFNRCTCRLLSYKAERERALRSSCLPPLIPLASVAQRPLFSFSFSLAAASSPRCFPLSLLL